jgi:hypothetical protein
MAGYGDKLVTTNSVVQTVHILATTTINGYVTTHHFTACGLTDLRLANATQVAMGARCKRCTSAATNEHAAWWQRNGMAGIIDMVARWSEAQLSSLPRREQSWFRSLRAGGFIPAADFQAASEAFHAAVERFTGTRRAGAPGDLVTLRARVAAVRVIPGSEYGKKGKPRPVQREIRLAGTGAHEGVEWITTTRSVPAGRLRADDLVKVTATVCSTYYRGAGGTGGVGQLVAHAAFRVAA